MSLALESRDFQIDYSMSAIEILVRTLSIVSRVTVSNHVKINYVYDLLRGLSLFNLGLQNEMRLALKKKYATQDWSFTLEPFNSVRIHK